MNCKFDEHIIHLYLDNELGENARVRVENHLQSCNECRSKYESLLLLKSELTSACAKIKSPPHLRDRVSSILDENTAGAKSGLTAYEKVRLFFSNAKTSRLLAGAFALAAVLFLLILPEHANWEGMKKELAHVYRGWPGSGDKRFADLSGPEEIQQYLYSELGLVSVIPSSLSGGLKLSGAEIIPLLEGHMAHIRYSNGEMDCSMFIFQELSSTGDNSRMMIISDRKFDVGSSSDVNFIHWHRGQTGYILCGCCCFEKLAHMAGPTI